jgi:hypothetical protein
VAATAPCPTATVAPTSLVPTAAASTVLALKAPTSAPTTPFPKALFPMVPVARALTNVAPTTTATALMPAFGYCSDSAKIMRLPAPAPALQHYNLNWPQQ